MIFDHRLRRGLFFGRSLCKLSPFRFETCDLRLVRRHLLVGFFKLLVRGQQCFLNLLCGGNPLLSRRDISEQRLAIAKRLALLGDRRLQIGVVLGDRGLQFADLRP